MPDFGQRCLFYTIGNIGGVKQIWDINNSKWHIAKFKGKYTRKRLVTVPEKRNNPKNMTARQCYARKIQFIPDGNFVFLDETGANTYQSQNKSTRLKI